MTESFYGISNVEWQPLKAICEPGGIQTGPFGSLLHQKDYLLEGTPIITVEHLGENRIIHQDLPCVSDADKKRLSRYIMREGDVIFSRVGSVDRRSLVRKEEDGWLFSGRCLRVRPNKNRIDPNYLSWFFGLESFKEYIRGIAVGATMPSLNTEILSNIPIPLLPLSEQRAIADVLSALDDKIELNRRMNQTLEELAQTLFKHWFIDNPERESWKQGSLSDLCEIAIGGDWGTEIPTGNDTKVICLRGVDLEHLRKEGFSPDAPVRWIKTNSLQKRKMTDCDILIAGSGVGPVGRPLWISPSLFKIYDCEITYSNFCKRLTAKLPSYALFIDRILHNLHQSKEILDFVNGTSLPNLDINGLVYQYPILIPPQELVDNYYKTIEPFISLLFSRESQTLAELRDTLLPKLMSGQVRVKIGKMNMPILEH